MKTVSGSEETPSASGESFSGRVVSNAALLTRYTLIRQLANGLYYFWVVRALSQTQYGGAVVAGTLVGFFGLAADLGQTQLLGRELARHPEQRPSLFFHAMGLCLLATALALMLVQGAAWGLGYDAPVREMVTWGAIGLLALPLANLFSAVFNGAQVLGPPARLSALMAWLKLLLSVPLLLRLPTGVAYLALEAAFGTALGAALWMMARRHHLAPAKPAFDLTQVRFLLREGLPFVGVFAAYTFYNRIDLLMLDYFQPKAEVARYAASYRFFEYVVMLPGLLAAALLPTLSASFADKERFARGLRRGFLVFLVLGAFSGGAAIFFSPMLVKLLGPAYSGTEPVLRWLMLGTPFYYACYAPMNGLNASGNQRGVMVVVLAGLVLNVSINLHVLPRWGAQGAALVNSFTLAFYLFAYLALCRRAMGWVRFWQPRLWRLGAIFALAAGAACATHLWWSKLAAGFVFMAIFAPLLLKGFPFEEDEKGWMGRFRQLAWRGKN